MLKKLLTALVVSAFALGTVYAQAPKGEMKGEQKKAEKAKAKAKSGEASPKKAPKTDPKKAKDAK